MHVCPSCGRLTSHLVDYTGWCVECTPKDRCADCGKVISNGYLLNGHKYCSLCKLEAWYRENADLVEYQLALGLSITQAIDVVTRLVRPRCLSCGGFIYYGARGRTYFCTRNVGCRRAARRLKYYKRDLGISHDTALVMVVETLTQQGVV